MDSNSADIADRQSKSSATEKRGQIGATVFILRLIAAATIVCSFVQVVRGGCTAMSVIQFWLSLFFGAAVQGAAGDWNSQAVESERDRGDGRALTG